MCGYRFHGESVSTSLLVWVSLAPSLLTAYTCGFKGHIYEGNEHVPIYIYIIFGTDVTVVIKFQYCMKLDPSIYITVDAMVIILF